MIFRAKCDIKADQELYLNYGTYFFNSDPDDLDEPLEQNPTDHNEVF